MTPILEAVNPANEGFIELSDGSTSPHGLDVEAARKKVGSDTPLSLSKMPENSTRTDRPDEIILLGSDERYLKHCILYLVYNIHLRINRMRTFT
jgi:hypothetical protein